MSLLTSCVGDPVSTLGGAPHGKRTPAAQADSGSSHGVAADSNPTAGIRASGESPPDAAIPHRFPALGAVRWLLVLALVLLLGAEALLGVPAAMAQDTTPPTLVSATVNGATLNLNFNEELDENSVPDRRRFSVHIWRGVNVFERPAAVAISGYAVMLTLHEPVPGPGAVLAVHYYEHHRLGDSKLKDPAGNEVQNIYVYNVVYDTDTTAPTLERAAVNGTALTLIFDEALHTGSAPAGTAFGVTATQQNGSTTTISGTSAAVTIDGATVSLTLASALASTDTGVKVSYTRPALNPLRDTTANVVASFTDQEVTNLAAPPRPPTNVTVSGAPGGSLMVSWTPAPGWGVTDYDVRYYAGNADPSNEADWKEPGESGGHDHRGAATSTTIRGLMASTAYRVQVRAARGFAVGPWSASGSGSTAAAPAGNHAPRLLVRTSGGTCREWTDTANPITEFVQMGLLNASSRPIERRGSETTEFPSVCARGGPTEPFFDDRDGDPLRFTFDYTLPDNVRFLDGTPSVGGPLWGTSSGVWLRMRAAAAFRDAYVTMKVTATDPHGASASALVRVHAVTFGSTGVPRFGAAVGERIHKRGAPITPLVLPGAIGGDLGRAFDYRRFRFGVGGNTFSYFYEASGLPPGLAFDPARRTVSGTPTTNGSWTVAYSAADADNDTGDGDEARQSFTVRVTDTGVDGLVMGQSLSMDFGRALDPRSRPGGDSFRVRATPRGGSARTISGTDSARIAGGVVTVPLASAVAAGESVTVSYTKPGGGNALRDAGGDEVGGFSGVSAKNRTPSEAGNRPATGAPTVVGTAHVGETLEASTVEIADADGVRRATFAYQWVSNDGTADADIAGATGASYPLVEADKGRTVKVRVRFIDDAGHAETLTSAATAVVTARLLTAGFGDVPVRHDGESEFGFELRFSEPLAERVTGGRVVGVSRTEPGQGRSWVVTVRPSSSEDVTVALPAAADCGAAGAVCTADGRGLSSAASVTVAGPADEVATDAPAVTQLEVVSDAGGDGIYALGETIRVRLTFDAAVDVTGAPRLKLGLRPADGDERWAVYASGGGTAQLAFAYAVAEGDASAGGVAVLADTLELDGGTIAAAEGGTTAALSHVGIGADPEHRVDGVRPRVAEAVIDGEELTVTFDETLAPASEAPERTALRYRFFVKGTIAGTEQSPDRVAVDGREVTLGLGMAAKAGQQITVSYTLGRGDRLRDAAGNEAAAFTDTPVTNATPGPETPPNSPATGAPTIAGTAQVGETLTAETTGIADADGLSEATFAYQWLTNDADIAGATGASYTLTDTQAGRTVKVRVTFTDDAGHEETLTSAATEPVAARPLPPLTASFVGAPAAHDGRSAFSFELRFSENFPGRLSYKVFKDHALQVTNGRATGVSRAAPGQNQRWTITVRPWSSEDVTVTLSAAADCSASAAVCTPDGRVLSNSPSATVSGPGENQPPPNTPATGAPTIAGTAQVGETLTASTAGIADANGLTGATFAYQWLSNDTDIAGATGASLTLADAQVGRTVKVRVTFTDDAGHAETLTSAATAAVVPRPLTASFVGVPGEHDGRTAFSFELRFSDNFPGRLSYKVLKDQALQVTNGRAIGVKRAAPGQNQRWSITVRPWSADDVTVTLAAGSVSTESGRVLSNTVAVRVLGPPLLSVADAEAREGEDAAVEFAVTLSRAASGTVTVDFATADGTATAGEDYTATSGTLTFAVGETHKTVAVPILDDTHDEGQETFTLRLSNASGAGIRDGEATGTIQNNDPMPKAWTARFGRSVAVHVVDAVEARLDGTSQSYVQLGGHRLGGGPDVHETVQRLSPERDLWSEAAAAGMTGQDPGSNPGQAMTPRQLLLGSAFHLVSDAEDEAAGPRLSAWGRVATSGFDGREDKVSLDGTVTTATLGVDGVWDRWLTGLLLAYSEGDGSFTHVDMPGGDLTSSLTSVHPYVAYTLSDRVRLWGLVGYGSGALQLRLEDKDAMDTDLTMSMGAVGIRGTLLQPLQPGGLELALRSDVMWVGMNSAAAHNLAATEADASRLRLVLEGSRPVALAGGGTFTPSLEVGLRHDGGDADTGTGVEVGGRLRYASAWGLSIEASLRGLLAHEASDYREWGASAALRFDPGRRGRGFTASIMPTWGFATSGVQRLWGQPGTPGLAPADPLAPVAAGRLDAELGYGLATLNGRGLLTPYARVALTEGTDQAWHLGTRLALAESLNLSLEASRRSMAGAAAAHDLALLATLGF